MASTTANSFSFQPWARNVGEENLLKDTLGRVHLERGHFRDITEASLQEEVAAEGALQLSESEDDEDEDENEDEAPKAKAKPTTREELYKTKHEMLDRVRAAEQEILMSLDFVSLLLSKDMPKQAATSMSPFLKEAVPLASLGADVWQRMPADPVREAQDELLTTKVRMEGLQQSADSLLGAANRLQDNVRRETEYWSQILSISEKGWNVCRIPGPQRRLGVRFGFNESSVQFSRRGIAALDPRSDGTIVLERGVGSKPKALHAVLREDGKVIGSSKLSSIPSSEETTLEARIHYARDSLYDEELYHEMVRESRTLASFGVTMKDSAINIKSHPASKARFEVAIDLVSLDDGSGLVPDVSNAENGLAEATVLAARLLLSHAHRDKLRKRSDLPPPISDKQKDERPPLPILRPVMAFAMHRSALDRLNAYLEVVASVLQAAQIDNSLQRAQFELLSNVHVTNMEALTNALMRPWTSEAQLQLKTPNATALRLGFKVESTLAYNNSFGSIFTLTVPSRNEGYRFDNLDEMISAADVKLASALAKATVESLGDDWTCNEHEALLTTDAGIGEKNASMWVSFNSRKRLLSLSSFTTKVLWTDSGETSETGFWDVCDAVQK
ncbi:RNA polymerase II mediator complex subunit [Vermiconidia calcicola]|uniref:RNA polymerase II mediator complex subunit n=1 Tax=Vermiconidia calcicola TaxID=1690605 RepID=A0ACC3MUK9_9PEZI|nr:RNA polymerase II mediator complex subunit [Vermiconidia calcicola]